MKLVGSLTSPYVRKVRIVLHEKKIDHDFVVEVPWDADNKISQLNPLEKVPVLEIDEGLVLYDSSVITDFLESLTPNNRLLPQGNRFRAMAKCAEALAMGINDAGAAIFVEIKMHPKEHVSQSFIDRNLKKIERGVARIAENLGDNQYLIEDTYTIADIASGSALHFLEVLNHRKMINFDWRTQYPNLGAYVDRLNTRPSFIDTLPPMT